MENSVDPPYSYPGAALAASPKPDPARTCVSCKWYKHVPGRKVYHFYPEVYEYVNEHACVHPDGKRTGHSLVTGPWETFEPQTCSVRRDSKSDACGPSGNLYEHACPPCPPNKAKK